MGSSPLLRRIPTPGTRPSLPTSNVLNTRPSTRPLIGIRKPNAIHENDILRFGLRSQSSHTHTRPRLSVKSERQLAFTIAKYRSHEMSSGFEGNGSVVEDVCFGSEV